MFSLKSIKQKKYEDRATVIETAAFFKARRRPIHKFNCNGSVAIIAEIKKASPSKGLIKIVDPVQQALCYKQAGAKAISVLTDNHYFGGSFEDLHSVANAVDIPVLCKEFICYKEQIDAAYILGADIILLIASMLTPEEMHTLYHYTLQKGLTPLTEVHTRSELQKVMTLNPSIIMVNMRNLNTLEIDHKTGIETLQAIPPGITKVCASSINDAQMLRHLYKQTGATVFLIGTALMQTENPAQLLQELCHVC